MLFRLLFRCFVDFLRNLLASFSVPIVPAMKLTGRTAVAIHITFATSKAGIGLLAKGARCSIADQQKARARFAHDNEKQYLTIHKVDLEACKMYDFYRKDLKGAIEAAQKRSRDEEAKAYIEALQLAEKKKESLMST